MSEKQMKRERQTKRERAVAKVQRSDAQAKVVISLKAMSKALSRLLPDFEEFYSEELFKEQIKSVQFALNDARKRGDLQTSGQLQKHQEEIQLNLKRIGKSELYDEAVTELNEELALIEKIKSGVSTSNEPDIDGAGTKESDKKLVVN